MFQKTLGFIALISITIVANAKDYATVVKDVSEKGSKQIVTYDELLKGTVPAASSINQQIIDEVMYAACGPSDQPEVEYDYKAKASLLELKKSKYVAYEISFSYFCGGLYPDAGSYVVVFDADDGEKLDLETEVPLQALSLDDEDQDEAQRYRMEMSAFLVDNIPNETKKMLEEDCFLPNNRDEAIEQISYLTPGIQGIGKALKVIVGVSPPHASRACAFNFEVSFDKVEKYFAPESKIRKWATAK